VTKASSCGRISRRVTPHCIFHLDINSFTASAQYNSQPQFSISQLFGLIYTNSHWICITSTTMSENKIPSTMRAWQYSSAAGGIEKHLRMNPLASLPTLKPDENLIRVIAMALNPVDYKPVEVPFIGRFTHSKNAIPGLDVVGQVVKPAAGSSFKVGQVVFGVAGSSLFAGGAMADYATINVKTAVPVPEGVDLVQAGTVGIAGVTAYQSIVPFVKPASRVFINGGSGGTGTYGIQIAKAVGCHITTTCSTPNVELCKSLGADEVIDYKKGPVLEQLKKQKPFDLIVDNVGADYSLFFKAHEYSNPSAKYAFVGVTPSLGFFGFMIKASVLPGFLGGAKRKMQLIFAEPKSEDLSVIGHWMAEGKVRGVIDQRFTFEQGIDAIKRQKTGRARGKMVIDVAPELAKS